MEDAEKLKLSLQTSFLDSGFESDEGLRSKLLINDYHKGTKVLSHLLSNLKACDEFFFSVAFITTGGLVMLLDTLRELEEKGIKGKIITTNYLNFSQPRALKRLLGFKNIEVKVYDKDNFHTKGYIFKKGNHYDLIVGSSNLTQDALTKNQEWNLKISSLTHGEITQNILQEFNQLFAESTKLTEEWIEEYSKIYKSIRVINTQVEALSEEKRIIRPNTMQTEALNNLAELRIEGKNKALLISATGTGKTYLSAFDVMQYNPRKVLFVVHREQIAKAAMKSFKNIFGDTKTYGILSGNSHDVDADFLFCTIQTISKTEYMHGFVPDYFDYIIFDEVHRAGAASYKKIIDYFKPKFLLGMTATPERSDGFNIYELFDYNIAYEIRLQKALENDMLCPFHYFGVSEIEVDGEIIDDTSSLNYLVSEERVDYIVKQAKFYGHSGNRVKGLVFCSRNEEARILSEEFNKRGYHTLALSGANTQQERENAVRRLSQDDGLDNLDYIFTVDIFNEGVDIPEVNQIIMLRPTESAIIFVQQLGRGLRKVGSKDYVVVIDFIGNYNNNYLIPIALSGDRTFSKDALRAYVMEGICVVPGCSTIMFDKISEQKIFDSINRSNFSTLKQIKAEYVKLKDKVGRIPTLNDFYEFGAIDPQIIISNSDSYHAFLKKAEPEYQAQLGERQEKSLIFVSKEISNGKRLHELAILGELIESEELSIGTLESILDAYGIKPDIASIKSAINCLNNKFNIEQERKKYGNISYCSLDGEIIRRNATFGMMLKSRAYYSQLQDLLTYAMKVFEKEYRETYRNTNLVLYKKYSKKDVCKLLNWDKNEQGTVYGYRAKHGTCPIFVTYKKSDDISESTKYNEHFINRNIFSWVTRSRRTTESSELQPIIHNKKFGNTLHLFIKKADSEGSDYYYLGIAEPTKAIDVVQENTGLPIVSMQLVLKDPVREDIYDYLRR